MVDVELCPLLSDDLTLFAGVRVSTVTSARARGVQCAIVAPLLIVSSSGWALRTTNAAQWTGDLLRSWAADANHL